MSTLTQHLLVGLVLICSASPAPGQDPLPGETDTQITRLLELAGEYQQAGQYQRAITTLLKVVDLDGVNLEAWERLAWLYNEKKDYPTARLAALVVLRHNPDCSNAWRELGYAEWHLDRPNQAVLHLVRALELNEMNFPAYDYLAEVLLELGYPQRAAAVQEKKAQAQKKRSTRIEL